MKHLLELALLTPCLQESCICGCAALSRVAKSVSKDGNFCIHDSSSQRTSHTLHGYWNVRALCGLAIARAGVTALSAPLPGSPVLFVLASKLTQGHPRAPQRLCQLPYLLRVLPTPIPTDTLPVPTHTVNWPALTEGHKQRGAMHGVCVCVQGGVRPLRVQLGGQCCCLWWKTG